MDANGAPLEESSTESLVALEDAGASGRPLSGHRTVAVDPALAPPLAPSAHAPLPSKRRWTPSTWRYAIEEMQPELASKPRAHGNNSNGNSAALGAASRESRRKAASENAGLDRIPARLSPSRAGYHHYYNQQQAWLQQQQQQQEEEEEAYRRALQRRREAEEDRMGAGSWLKHNKQQQQQQQQRRQKTLGIHGAKRRSPSPPAMASMETEQEAEVEALYGQQRKSEQKRRKRELTPSELYFCEICGAKEGNGSNDDHDHSSSR